MADRRELLRRVDLQPRHQPKGNVHYFMEGRPMPRPSSLEIVKGPTGTACYMLYLDNWGAPMTETWHPTPDAAAYHAKWEYGIELADWEDGRPG